MTEAKQTTTPRGTWVLMGPDFLGDSTTFSRTQAKRETASHTCPGVAPHSTQTRHPRPWLVCSGAKKQCTPGLSQNHFLDRTSASSRKPMVVALSSSTYYNSGAPRWPRSAFMQKTLVTGWPARPQDPQLPGRFHPCLFSTLFSCQGFTTQFGLGWNLRRS